MLNDTTSAASEGASAEAAPNKFVLSPRDLLFTTSSSHGNSRLLCRHQASQTTSGSHPVPVSFSGSSGTTEENINKTAAISPGPCLAPLGVLCLLLLLLREAPPPKDEERPRLDVDVAYGSGRTSSSGTSTGSSPLQGRAEHLEPPLGPQQQPGREQGLQGPADDAGLGLPGGAEPRHRAPGRGAPLHRLPAPDRPRPPDGGRDRQGLRCRLCCRDHRQGLCCRDHRQGPLLLGPRREDAPSEQQQRQYHSVMRQSPVAPRLQHQAPGGGGYVCPPMLSCCVLLSSD